MASVKSFTIWVYTSATVLRPGIALAFKGSIGVVTMGTPIEAPLSKE